MAGSVVEGFRRILSAHLSIMPRMTAQMKDMMQVSPAIMSVQPTAVCASYHVEIYLYNGAISEKFTVEPTRPILSCKDFLKGNTF